MGSFQLSDFLFQIYHSMVVLLEPLRKIHSSLSMYQRIIPKKEEVLEVATKAVTPHRTKLNLKRLYMKLSSDPVSFIMYFFLWKAVVLLLPRVLWNVQYRDDLHLSTCASCSYVCAFLSHLCKLTLNCDLEHGACSRYDFLFINSS